MRFTRRHRRFVVVVVCIISLAGLFGQMLSIIFSYPRVHVSSIKQGREINISQDDPLKRNEEFVSAMDVLDMSRYGNEWRRKAMIFETDEQKRKRFLTIGIPTVRRKKTNYMMDTLDSLVHYTSNKFIADIYIVIFIAEFNSTLRYEMANKIKSRYTNLVQNGTIQLIQAPKEFYPRLDNLNHTYVDPEIKKKWRSKQNVDYAFLWLYSKSLSTYYMQMEDDIYTVPDYLDIIKNYIATQRTPWICLEFSELGFIGKVYHSKYLERLAKMVLLFYEEQPVDVTYLHFNTLNFQPQRIIRKPTIFQHVGYHSSLEGKIQPLKDSFFKQEPKSLKGDNPPAVIITTLKMSPYFNIQNAYTHDNGFSWSIAPPTIRDSIHILFNEPQSLDKVVILSGSRDFPTDKLDHAKLEACLNIERHFGIYVKCLDATTLGISVNGTLIAADIGNKLHGSKVICLKISFAKNNHYWLLLKEIAVFLNKM